MRTLKFGPSLTAEPTLLEGNPPFRTWHDQTGHACAHGYRRGPQVVMHWPALGRYIFTQGAATVDVEPVPGVSSAAVADVFDRFVLPLTLLADGFEVIHASAVVTPHGVVAFCADCEGGKSTVAFELNHLGLPQWADDAVAIRIDGARAQTWRLPFRPRLRQDAAAFFGTAVGAAVPCSAITEEQAPIAAVCLLRRDESAGMRLEPLSGSAALVALLNHARVLDPDDESRRDRMLDHYLNVAASVPVLDLRIPSGFHRLKPALLDLGARLAWWETRVGNPCLV